MKYSIIPVLLLLAVCSGCAQTGALRLMTYNIRHGAGMDDVVSLDRQAEVIRKAHPDVVGLQEVDSIVHRSGHVDEAKYLAERLGMHATFGSAIPLSGGKYGVAILSKERPLSVRNIPLPGREPRTLLVCEFDDYVFACTHLDLEEKNRLSSLSIIRREAEHYDKPFYICGDWNDTPSSPLLQDIGRSFTILSDTAAAESSLTFPADKPDCTIDYIAAYTLRSTMFRVSNCKVLSEPAASDHRPITLKVKKKRCIAL